MSTLDLFDGNGSHGDMRTKTNTALTTLNNDKEEKVAGKGLSSEDFTTTEKSKLANITKSDITDFSDSDYATAAQGSKADSALQDITAQSIKSLSDVLTSMTPTAGQVLTYNITNGWQAANAAAGGSVSWGDIIGTLSAQVDLQAALNTKDA